MKYVCPLIAVEDITRSRRFYEELLGQRVKMDFGQNVTFDGDFAIHERTHYESLLGEGRDVRLGTNAFELYFEDDAVEEIRDRLRAAGVPFVHDLREQPWRQRVLRVEDPDAHIVEIGETMPAVVARLAAAGLSREEITTATSLPGPFVDAILHS